MPSSQCWRRWAVFTCCSGGANAAQRPFTAQELAAQSGYRSYRTFSVAFRERKGQSVTAWMNEEESA